MSEVNDESAEVEKLDDLDIGVLISLQTDSSLSNAKAAQQLRIKRRRFAERRRKLERLKIVAGYGARVDIKRLFEMRQASKKGWPLQSAEPFLAFAEITLVDLNRAVELQRELCGMDVVVGCWKVSGAEYDYIVHFFCPNQKTYFDQLETVRRMFGAKAETRMQIGDPLVPFGSYRVELLKLAQFPFERSPD